MKKLIILRHGKSSWDNYNLGDFDRPLSERGERNAAEIGSFIKVKSGVPKLILTSSAVRALQTATIAAGSMDYQKENIQSDRILYLAWSDEILRRLSETPDDIDYCLLVGHNPGLTELINYFGVRLDNLPTGSAACFEFDVSAWKNISRKNTKFRWIQLAREL